MTWSDEAFKWHTTISVDGGKDAEYSQSYDIISDFVISAIGQLCKPKGFDIAGLSDFEGKVMHSARWDRGFDLSGKKVAIIGTGLFYLTHRASQTNQVRLYFCSDRAGNCKDHRTSHCVPKNARICHPQTRSCAPSMAAATEVLRSTAPKTDSRRSHEFPRTLPFSSHSE